MDIGYRGLTVRPGLHMISMYQDLQEAMAIVSSILGTGLKQDEMCLLCGSPGHAKALHTCLGFEKLDPEQLIESRRLQVHSVKERFLTEGVFDPDILISLIRQFIRHASDIDHRPARMAIDLSGLAAGKSDFERILEFESKLHKLVSVPDLQVLACCMYDMSSVDAEEMIKLLNWHPLAIIDESVRINPYHCEFRNV